MFSLNQLETWIRQEFSLLQASLIEKAEEQRNESSAYIDKRASVMIEGKEKDRSEDSALRNANVD